MSPSSVATVVIVPGLRDHVEQHWQTLLEARLRPLRPVLSVAPLQVDALRCEARVLAIEQAVRPIQGPVIFVAHSGGVIMLLHWARRYRHQVKGALLAAPPDFDHPLPAGYPTMDNLQSNGWFPVPKDPLPFPSLVAASTNDPLASFDRVQALARQWGSELVNLGAVGHLNPASGYGEWPGAMELIARIESA